MTDYYHERVTQKSWETLLDIRRQFSFVLIGGWAVYLYTRSLKSKDIDMIVSLEELEKLKQNIVITKNERLKKYHSMRDETDIDIYVAFFSDLGLPVEKIAEHSRTLEGFLVPEIEALLMLKQHAYLERAGSSKGQKDALDIISLLKVGIDFARYQSLLTQYGKEDSASQLRTLIQQFTQVPELALNERQFSRLKKQWLQGLE